MALFTRSKAAGDVRRPESPPADDPELEPRIRAAGLQLLQEARRQRSGVLSKAFWSGKLIDWAMKDEAFKVQLFRFVDAYPALCTPAQVHDHLVDYLSQPGVNPPPGLGLGVKAGGLLKGALAKTVSSQITSMAGRFIAGSRPESALPQLQKLWQAGIAFSVDLLGEACVSDAEAAVYQHKYLDLVQMLPAAVRAWPPDERLEQDHLGLLPRANVSVKISALYARADPIEFQGSVAGLAEALRPILEAARERGVFVNFDIESHKFKDLTLDLFMRCAEAVDFPAGIALQAYLRSGDEDARRIVRWAQTSGRVVTVRLVKGAYWDYETIHAEQMGWPVPVWSRKADTDACFERMAAAFVEATPDRPGKGGVKLALGSHNIRSISAGLAMTERRGLPTSAIEVQCLHGMGEEIKAALVERAVRVREYVPVGEMIPGMAYLVRRLLENTSNESWLRASFLDEADPETLLASPHAERGPDPGIKSLAEARERHALSPAPFGVGDGRPFFNEPLRDFADAAQREQFAEAIAAARVPRAANDATAEDARAAVRTCLAAFPAWCDLDARKRAETIVNAASVMRRRRDELCGIEIREAGKTWREADADVCEAIDFCEYYARLAIGLFEDRRLGAFAGELDQVFHQPRGVAAIISPWNFPIAICCGMTVAALVTGNTVVLKPAEQTPGCAAVLCEILWGAGVPRDVLRFLPGPGEVVGAALVRDTRVAVIAFTGSKAVGLDIVQAAGVTLPEQSHVKKVICEMGGKNAIIIDASADLDEAVIGVRNSAFGYSGQKCSACSRAIVVESAHEVFLRRLVESTQSLVIGDPMQPGTDVGPVIDTQAAAKIRSYIEIGNHEGRLETSITVPAGLEQKLGRAYVAPHVFSGIAPQHRLANEEIFGPVLSVIRVRDFDEALQVANAASYKLTGGVFSRKPSHLERARREFRVGNLYLNRGITGALVARQPFGGFGLSGVGSKAGGEAYLLQFVEPRSVCENTMRRGFAPGV